MKISVQQRMITILAAVTLSLSALAAGQLDGQPAPDFVLKSASGENMRLSEYRGDVVLLNFWASWCGDCRDQLDSLDSLYGLYHEAGLQLLSINLDNQAERAADLARRLDYPVLYDSERQVSRLYDVDAMPVTLLIDREGVVRYVQEGYRRGAEARYVEQLKTLLRE